MSNQPHFDKAFDYAWAVHRREVIASVLTRLAGRRFLNDLYSKTLPFYFDAEAAEHACDYIERLPHVKGEWAKRRELLVLGAWQCFIVCNIFGWKLAEDRTGAHGEVVGRAGTRRFRTAYIEVARKNAKSTLAAAIGLYMLDEDGEEGEEASDLSAPEASLAGGEPSDEA